MENLYRSIVEKAVDGWSEWFYLNLKFDETTGAVAIAYYDDYYSELNMCIEPSWEKTFNRIKSSLVVDMGKYDFNFTDEEKNVILK